MITGSELEKQFAKNTRRRNVCCVSTKEHIYLNFAETERASQRKAHLADREARPRWEEDARADRQAVRSLGPCDCTCYQACMGGLCTGWSARDLTSLLGSEGE